MRFRKEITAERVRELIDYSVVTGRIYRKNGAPIGFVQKGHGYVVVCLDGVTYYAHRVIWLWVTGCHPTEEVDHRNGLKDNNAWHNLREASHGQNHINKRAWSSSGVKNVYPHQKGWIVRMTVDGTQRYFGTYKTLEEAAAISKEVREKVHGEFVNHD